MCLNLVRFWEVPKSGDACCASAYMHLVADELVSGYRGEERRFETVCLGSARWLTVVVCDQESGWLRVAMSLEGREVEVETGDLWITRRCQ